MEDNNVKVQASEEVSYDSYLKGTAKHINREEYCMQQICGFIDDAAGRAGDKCLSLLELGFGDGTRFRELCSRYQDASFIGLEVRKEPVESMAKLGYDCRLVETEMFDEFFTSGERFDVIYGYGVIHHMSDPYKSMESLIKLLKPGGIIVLFGEHHRFDLLSHLNATVKGNWAYEKNAFKVKRKSFKQLLDRHTKNYHIEYDNNGFVICFKKLNSIYCKLRLHRVPLWNCMTIFARVD